MKITYVGPFDAVDINGVTVKRKATIDVDDDVAGHPPDDDLDATMLELRDAVEAFDHERAAELRERIIKLDAGAGLLAQTANWHAKARKDEEAKP